MRERIDRLVSHIEHRSRLGGRVVAAVAAALLLALSALVVPHVVAGTVTAEAASSCSEKYVVQWGDSWSAIASRSKSSLSSLLAANNAEASTPLYAGVTICLADGATVPTTTTVPVDPSASTTVPAPTTTLPPVIPIEAFPVQGNCWYTDTWGAPRGGGRKHEGVDIIAKAGQYLYAVVDGTLTRQAVDRPGSLSGNAWWLTAPNGDYFFYAHLSAFAPGLGVGSTVQAGQVIGWVGTTGSSSTPHLHFEVHPGGGRAVNPTPTVRAVDACRVTKPLPQPNGAPPPTMPPPTTTTTAPAPTTTMPAPAPTTTKPAPAPATTLPVTSVCTETYRVQRGDGWFLIASRNKVALRDLLAANNLTSWSAPLYAGATICLRAAAAPPPPTTVPPTTVPPSTTKPAPAPVTTLPAPTTTKPALAPATTLPVTSVCTETYRVQRGDGWFLIASRNKVALRDLLAANNLTSWSAPLYAGATICLRAAAAPPPPTTVPPTTVPPTTVPPTTVPPTTVPPATLPPTTVPSAPTLPAAGTARWQFIAPKTAFDSAWSRQPLGAGVRQWVRVDRTAGVPPETTGVVVRLTARSAGAGGYLVTYPCDGPMPTVSQLSFDAGETAVGTSMVEVVGGSVCVSVSSPAHVKVEVLAAESPSGVGAQPVPARRALDTRTTKRLAPGVRVPITPATLGVVPGTQALTASITLVDPAAAGTLSLGFCNDGPWRAAFPADRISSFTMTMRVNSSGWCLSSTVATHVIVDVNTVWAGTAGPQTVDPARVFDSRTTGARIGTKPVVVQVAGRNGVPAAARAAVLSVTSVTGAGAASIFVVPCGQSAASGTVTASWASEITTGSAVVGLGSGAVCVSSTSPADVIIDVVGFT